MDVKSGIYTSDIDDRSYSRHVFYRVEFKDNKGNEYIADILTRSPLWYGFGRRGNDKKPIKISGHDARPNDYANFFNAGELIEGAFSPLTISRTREDHTDPMYTSTATLTVWSDTDSKFLHLTQETDAVMLYVWTRKSNILHRLIFSGVLDTSQYTEPYSKKDRYFVELTFQEYGQLKRTRHNLIQGQTVQEHIRTLLKQRFDCCGYREDLPDEDVPLDFGVKGIRPDISLFEDDNGKRDDAYSVLNMLLKNFGFTLVQTNNVLERVGLTQIYIKKGEPFKNEPKLKEKSNDNTLTITEQAKEVEVTVKIAGVDKESKAVKYKDIEATPITFKYNRHDLGRVYNGTYYPAYELNFKDCGGGFYIGKTTKQTEGAHDEEFFALFVNTIDVVTRRLPMGGDVENRVYWGKEKYSYALPEHRVRGGNGAPSGVPIGGVVSSSFEDKEKKFTVSGFGLVMCDVLQMPKVKNNTDNYFFSLSLSLKVGLYTNIYHELREPEFNRSTIKDREKKSIENNWANYGAYLFGAVLALNDDNEVVAYLKSEHGSDADDDERELTDDEREFGTASHAGWYNYSQLIYSWESVERPKQVWAEDLYTAERTEIKKGASIDASLVREFVCVFPYGSKSGLKFNSWEKVENPPLTVNELKKEEAWALVDDDGVHVYGLPKDKNGNLATRVAFVCFRKLYIKLKERETYYETEADIRTSGSAPRGKWEEGWKDVPLYLGENIAYRELLVSGRYPFIVPGTFGTFGSPQGLPYYPNGNGQREILSPYYILVKDPAISVRDFQTVLNQGEEYKESKTTIKSIYSKGNTDAIKEELLYDDKMDIPLTSPSRVFAPHADAITPEAQGADFRFFSFSDLRAFDILTKKGVGLINMEGTFDFNPFRHWGVFYHRGNKYIASREEIDLKAGKSIMTVHQLAQADPNTITKKVDKND